MVLGLDVGGTKLAAGMVDTDGRLVGRRQVATPKGTDGEELFAVVTELIDTVRDDHADAELVGFGVGCGGPMTSTGVSPLNIHAWRGFPLRDRLEAHTGLP